MNEDLNMLCMYVRSVLAEDVSWEDPSVVYFKNDEEEENDDESPDAGSNQKLSKEVEKNSNLSKRDTNASANKNMASMKPTPPSNQGGPMSGRMPGNRSFTPGVKSYNAGY